MSQQIINLGVGPDSQTGDSLYVAFNKVNTNFTELYSVFDGNAITAVNANVVYTNNVVTSANVRSGNIFTYGNIESIGYVITSGVFYPNGVPLGSLSAITTNLIPLTSNIYTVGNVTNQFTEGYFSSNITLSGSNVTVRNGVLYIDGDLAEANYSNANVANYLPIYGGNIAATVTTSSQPYITELGTLTGLTVSGNTIISGNLDVNGTITYLNVRDFSVQDPIITLNTGPNGAPLISNNGFDSGVRTYYFDTENRAAFFGRASDTGYFEYYSNVQSEVGNIISGTYGTVKTGNIVLTGEANLAGNITSNYFLGNGRYLTGIDTTLISNETSNVKVYANGNIAISSDGISNVAVFTSIGGNVSGDFFITGTIKALNYIGNVQGNLSAPGLNTQILFNDNDTVGAVSGLTFNKTTNVLTVSNSIVTTGNVTVGGYTVIDSSGNVVTSRLVNSGVVAGTYGNASAVPVITVDTKGRITVANTTAVAGVNNVTYDSSTGNLTVFTSAGTTFSIDTNVGTSDSPIFAGLSVAGNTSVNALTINNSATIGTTLGVVGNINAGQINVAGYNVIDSTGNVVTSRLIDSGVTAGTYGNASAVPVITVDTKGRITVANTTAVAGVNNVTYDVTTGNLTVFTSAGTTFSIDTNVGTSDSPIFAGLSVAGNTSVNALTINNSATIGTTLGVVGNINAGQINVAGYNVIDSTGNVVTSRLIDSGVTVGTYGNASAVPVITVDSKGRITVANTTAVAGVSGLAYDQTTGNLSISTSAGTTFYVDLNVGIEDTPTFANVIINQNLTATNTANVGQLKVNGTTVIDTNAEVVTSQLKNSGVFAGIYGNANAVPVFSVDIKGRVTGVTNVAIDGISSVVYDSPSGNLSITTSDGTLRGVDIGVGTSDSPVFAGLSVYGNTTVNALSVNNSTTINGTLGVTGNITGSGATLSGSLVTTGPARVAGGLQATPIGNVNPSTAIFTSESVSGNSTVNALTVNNSVTVGNTLSASGNITAPWFIGNVAGNISAPGATWQVLFNDGGIISADPGLWFNGTQDILTVAGNVEANAITTNSDVTIGQSLRVAGRIWLPLPDGNAPFVITSKTVSENLNADLLDGYHANNGPSINTVAVRDGLGNLVANGIQIFGSGYFTNVLAASGGIQNTSIGNLIPEWGNFTVLGANYYAVLNELTVNNSANIGANLGVTGIINGSSLQLTGNQIINGNITSNGLTVNNSTTIGGTLGVTGNVIAGNISTTNIVATGVIAGNITVSNIVLTGGLQNTPVGNGIASTGNFTTLDANTSATLQTLQVNTTATVGTTLVVGSNITAGSLSINNSGTFGSTLGVVGNINGSSLTLSGSEVVGGTLQAQGGIQNTQIGNVTPSTAQFTTVNTSGNTTVAGLTSNGSITAGSTFSASGGIQNTQIGSITPSTGQFTTLGLSSNLTANALSVNNSATIGGTLGVTGNINGSSLTLTGSEVVSGTLQAQGGLQNTAIGNVTPNTALFTTVDASGNVTASALTVNNSTTIGGTLGVTGNITGSGATLSGSLVTTGSAQHLGGIQATPIGNTAPSTAQFTTVGASGNVTANALTVNNSATVGGTLSVTGNIVSSSLTLSGSEVLGGTLQAQGGLQNTAIGNVTPSTAQFTTASASGNVTANALTVNNSATIGGTLGVTGNITGSGATLSGSIVTTGSAQNLGGIQATPIGNVTPSTAQFTTVNTSGNTTISALTVNSSSTVGGTLGVTGNIAGSGLTLSGSEVVGETLQAQGGLQNTVIGNVTPNSAQFTTVNTSGNTTVAALTSNGSITAGSTFSATGGIQNTQIGSITPSTAQFTTASASGNVTASSLTVNNSTTIGTTLGVVGNATVGNLTTAGTVTITNTTQATGTGTGAFTVYGGASVTKDMWVGGNLYTSNLIATSTSNITVQDPLLYLTANTPYPYSYEIGFYSQFDKTGTQYQHTGLIRNHINDIWYLVSNVAEPDGGTVDLANANIVYDAVRTGAITVYGAIAGTNTLNVAGTATVGNLVSNGSISGGAISFANASIAGNLVANGITVNNSITAGTTLSAAGGIQNTPIGNVTPNTGNFTTLVVNTGTTTQTLQVNTTATVGTTLVVGSNATVNALTVNNSTTIGGTLGVTGNVNGSSLTLSGSEVVGGTLQAQGGIQATPIGNVTPSTAQFTTIGASGNVTASALTVNNSATVGGTLGVTGNINGSSLTLSGSEVLGGTLQAQSGLQNTAIGSITPNTALFTTVGASGNVTASALTVNNSATIGGTLGVTGNVNGSNLTLSGSEVLGGTLQAQGGIQNTAIGNVAPNTAQFTTVGASGNVTASALTVNNSATIGGTLGVTGNVNGSNLTLSGSEVLGGTLQAQGGIQNTAIGNVAPNTAQFTTVGASGNVTASALTVNNSATIGGTLGVTGNVNGSSLTLSGSEVLGGTLQAQGGIQATPIGNVAPSTAIFTSESVSGNSTVNALTVNTSATIGSTLGVVGNINGSGATLSGSLVTTGPAQHLGGIQATPIGNTAPSTALFTSVGSSGNITASGLAVNNSATVGSTLGVVGNINGSGATLSGSLVTTGAAQHIGGLQATPIGSVNPNTATFTSESVSGNSTVNALTVNNSATIGSTLGVTGNIIGSGATLSGSLVTTGPAQHLGGIQATPIGNTAPSTAQFTTVNASGNVTASALTVNTTATIGSTLGVTGNINGTSATLSGSLVSTGPAQHLGGLQATPIGNVNPSTALFTTIGASGNVTASALTVNNSTTVGGTLGVTGNAIVGNLTTASLTISANTPSTSNVSGAIIVTGGVGVGGNVYVGQRVGFVAANSVSAVYQVYNSSTNSLDTIFG